MGGGEGLADSLVVHRGQYRAERKLGNPNNREKKRQVELAKDI